MSELALRYGNGDVIPGREADARAQDVRQQLTRVKRVVEVANNAGRVPSSGPYGISSAVWAEALGLADGTGVRQVTEAAAMGVPAFFRGVSIIAGTVAGLPLKTYEETADGELRQRVPSILDEPGRLLDMALYTWKSLVATYMAIHGEAFLWKRRNVLGDIIAIEPVHPLAIVKVERRADGRKMMTMRQDDNGRPSPLGRFQVEYTTDELEHIIRLTLDGLRGVSPIRLMREAMSVLLSASDAARRLFTNGALISGLVTTKDTDVDPEEAQALLDQLRSRITGPTAAGDIVFLNADLQFTPWSMTAEDAQFMERTEFGITDVARMLGIPPHLLAQTEKQTSWGTGVTEQNRGLARFTLVHYTDPFQEVCSDIVGPLEWAEFDYSKMLQATPEEEKQLVIQQVNGGVLTVNEGRKLLNLPPLPGADTLRIPSGVIAVEVGEGSSPSSPDADEDADAEPEPAARRRVGPRAGFEQLAAPMDFEAGVYVRG